MRTQPLRQDRHCLNCGTEVPERYCTHCGQENTVPHESFGHLVKHFVADVVHYDSKTLLTLKYLLFRPGFLTKAYIAGKRASYVNPIRLYIFISFVFFLGYFPLSSEEKGQEIHLSDSQTMDSIRAALKKDSTGAGAAVLKQLLTYPSVKSYDSAQQALPAAERDGWLKRKLAYRNFYLREKYGHSFEEAASEQFAHNVPKLMFLLLPIFAWFLWILFDRRRWYYADHAIFSMHFHAFFFIIFLLATCLDRIFHSDGFSNWAVVLAVIYLVFALKHTYQQSTGKAVIKAVALSVAYLFTIGVVFLGFLLLAVTVIM